jgi:hypothetical protein
VCPTEEDLGMLMSTVVVHVHMREWDGGERGQRGLSEGTKNEAEVHSLVQRATIPSKIFIFYMKYL